MKCHTISVKSSIDTTTDGAWAILQLFCDDLQATNRSVWPSQGNYDSAIAVSRAASG